MNLIDKTFKEQADLIVNYSNEIRSKNIQDQNANSQISEELNEARKEIEVLRAKLEEL
jgi:hypothetical protein